MLSLRLQVREFSQTSEELAFLRAAEDAAFVELQNRWKVGALLRVHGVATDATTPGERVATLKNANPLSL